MSVKYTILGSFKEGVILECQINFKKKRMPSWHRLDLFTILLNGEFLPWHDTENGSTKKFSIAI